MLLPDDGSPKAPGFSMAATPKRPLTGRRRRERTTKRSVALADRIAHNVIRIGGIGTIAAVSTVFFFLLWVVWPLLRGEALGKAGELPQVAAAVAGDRMLATGCDDTFSVLWAWTSGGRFLTLESATGAVLSEQSPFDAVPTSFAFPVRASQGIFGFGDGTVRIVSIENRTEYRDADRMPQPLRDKPQGEKFLFEGKVAERVSVDQFAMRSIAITTGDEIAIAGGTAIHAVDLSITSNGPAFASVDANGVLRTTQATTSENFMTGEQELSTESGELALEAVRTRGLPKWVLLRGLADNAFAVWDDGHAVRVDVRDLTRLSVTEELDLLRTPAGAAGTASPSISAITFLTGKNTIVVGDTSGGLHAWFRIPAPSMATGDGAHVVLAHDLGAGPAAVTSFAVSARTRLLVAGHADGSIRVVHVTTDRTVAASSSSAQRPVEAIAIAPDDRNVVAWNGAMDVFALDAPHPEISLRALSRPVFYEGYPKPDHVWQSSSGTDEFEPKLGLWPLVFGTIKATLYAMLIGVPIALMAAIYTSEFLLPEVKTVVKPAIEMMASLPSVVLGFLAALILAPVVERSVPEVLTALVSVPFCVLLAAHGWQFLPGGRRAALQDIRFVLAGASILAGAAAAVLLGPVVERVLFAGDIHAWLDGRSGTATGGWLFVTLPLSTLVVSLTIGRIGVPPRSSTKAPRVSGALHPAAFALARFAGGATLAAISALGLAWLLSSAGFDLRGGVLGTYVQRNALVVGFVMAFAVVPIIYTIAEDALSSIPENLRAGSLALGATPWQTAVRIVVPTAMSGLFSAVMVGLGRAVGETMIVLMAAGNTPVLDWNVFSGFRTLSANLAVELPEAVRNGTHYRTLFLAALTLFVMTFVLNTAAELVRLRFRGRASQL
jgi:phosphate transport system permease protein